MKNTKKRGFTLIELLAVIVILAIIALIAVPIILNMINKARKKAAISSALGYMDSIEYYTGFRELGESGYEAEVPTGACTKTNNAWDKAECTTFYNAVDQKSKGSKPKNATVTIENGKVKANSTFEYNGYTVVYDGVEAYIDGEASSGGNSSTPQTNTAYQVGDSINFNPVTNTSCDTPTSTTGTNTGCMKWYVIKESGTSDSTVDVILDHNITTSVSYDASGKYKEFNSSSLKTYFDNDTKDWNSSLEPRLITAQEVADILEISTFSGSSGSFHFGSNDSKSYGQQSTEQKARQRSFAWLFNYLYTATSYGGSIADSSTSGYYTSSPVTNNNNDVWMITYNGELCNGGTGSSMGIRPVITIDKSQLN